MHQPQQFPYRPGNVTAILVARAPALRDPDFAPELLLVKAQSAAYFTRVEDLVEYSHGSVDPGLGLRVVFPLSRFQ
jgi:hypothetical protein